MRHVVITVITAKGNEHDNCIFWGGGHFLKVKVCWSETAERGRAGSLLERSGGHANNSPLTELWIFYSVFLNVWRSEIRAVRLTSPSDPWNVSSASSQTQEQRGANGPPSPSSPFPRQQLSIRVRCCIHNSTPAPAAPSLWELLNISSNSNLQSPSERFRGGLRGVRGRAGGQGVEMGEWRTGEGKRRHEEKMKRSSVRTFSHLSGCCDSSGAQRARSRPVLLTAGSQRCFSPIGWFATSLLIDNRRRERVISPSAERCS